MSLTPWDEPVPVGTRVSVKVLRFPRRDHPRAVVALSAWAGRGYRMLHLTRPVAFHSRGGKPAWLSRAVHVVRESIDGQRTAFELARIAQEAHRGQGIKTHD